MGLPKTLYIIRRNSILYIEGRLSFGQKFIESFTKSQSQSFRLCSFDLARLRRFFAPRITHMVFGSPHNQSDSEYSGYFEMELDGQTDPAFAVRFRQNFQMYDRNNQQIVSEEYRFGFDGKEKDNEPAFNMFK